MARDHTLRGGASQQVGRYQIQSHIASGGMGAVYLAFDPLLNRTVALKVLSPEMAAKPHMVARFHREAKSAAKLRHDHIVQIFDFGEANGTYFLALEFIDGTDLQDYIEQRPGGRLDIDEAIFVTIQAAKALDHAYAQGIVHRDIKPSNFLVTTRLGNLFIKLTDMGLARTEDDSRITRDNTTLGTVDYISPEQARDSSAADTRSDLYSLGCSLYHMLVGHAPYPKGTLIEKVQHHLYTPPPDIRASRPDVPDDLADIVFKLLAKDPNERYETPLHLLHDLMAPDEFAKYRSETEELHPTDFTPPARHKRPVDATVSLSKIDELPPPDPLFPADYRTTSTEAAAALETVKESRQEIRPAANPGPPPDQPLSVELTLEVPAPVPTPVPVPAAAPVPASASGGVPEKPAPARAAPVRPIEKPRPAQRPRSEAKFETKTEPPPSPVSATPPAKKPPGKKRPATPAAHERLRRREARRMWQSPVWIGSIAGALLLLAFLTWAAMALFSKPRLDVGPIEPVAVDPTPVIDPPKVKPSKVDPPVIDPKVDPKIDPKVDPKIDPKIEPKVDPKIDPPVEAKMGPPAPVTAVLAKAADAAGLEREALGPHAEAVAPAAGAKVLTVSRGVPPRGDSFAFFADAWREAAKLPAAIIEIDDVGPLPIPSLPPIAGKDIIIRGAPGIRPVLFWDFRSKDTSRNWIPLESGKLLVEGVDILVRDGPADGDPFACFQISGDLVLRDVTLTQTGGARPGVALVRVGGRVEPGRLPRIRIDRSYLRGRGVLAADMAAGGDLLVDGTLVLGKSRPTVLVSAPTRDAVNIRFRRSTVASSRAVVHAPPSADAVAPRVLLVGLDSIFACPSPDEAGVFLALGESVGVSGLTFKISHCAYAGWPTLLVGRQTRLTTLAQWRNHWGHQDGDIALDAPWPPLPTALDSAEAIEFSPLASPLALQSTRGGCPIGCPVGKLPDMPPADRLRPVPALALEFPDAGMPAIEPGEAGVYTGEVLDLSKGNIDLGDYLASKKLGPRVVIHLAGRGVFPSSPIQIADTHLVLYASPADMPIIEFKTVAGAPTAALIDIERGGLDLINVRVRLDWKRLVEVPAAFLRVRDASLNLTHCLVQTPLSKVPESFHSLITLDGVQSESPPKLTCRDSILLSGANVLTVHGPAAMVRWRHNFALGMDDLVTLAPVSAGKSGQFAALFEYNTFAAQKAFARFVSPAANARDLPPTVADHASVRPCAISTHANHFTSPTLDGNALMLRFEGNAAARGLLDWRGQFDAYDSSAIVRALAWGKDAAAAPFPQAWLDTWGAAAVVDPLIVSPKSNAKFNLDQPTLDRFVLPSTLRLDLPGANIPQLVSLLAPPKKK